VGVGELKMVALKEREKAGQIKPFSKRRRLWLSF
jgi:hypothetical protein